MPDRFNFGGAHPHHGFVIQRFVVHVAGGFLLFDAADAVLQAWRAGNGPRPCQGLWIALVREKALRVGGELHRDFRDLVHRGDAPWLRAIRKIAVGKNDHRHHVLQRNAAGFHGGPETIAGCGGSQHGNRRFRISPEHGLQQVRLFGFGGQASRRAAALDVADDQRKLRHYREAERFGFERHARAGGGGDGERAGIGRADGAGDGRDLVLGLKGQNAKMFVFRKFVENVRRGSDGIAAQIKFQTGFLRGGNKAHGERLIAAEIAIGSGGKLRRRNFVADLKRLGGLAIGISGAHGQLVGFGQQRLFAELFVNPANRGIDGAVIEPVAHAQREEVLAAVHALGVQAKVLERGAGQPLELDWEHAEFVERVVFQRIGGDMRLAQVRFLKAVRIDDQDSVGLQVGHVHFQRRRIHGHQHIHGVSRRIDFAGRKIQLIAADAGNRPRRGANFRGIVRKRGDVVAVKRDGVGELASGDLHSVARIAGKTDDRVLQHFAFRFTGRNIHQS